VLYEKEVDLVETDLMVEDPGCLLAGVPDLHVIVQVLRQKIMHYSKITYGEEDNVNICIHNDPARLPSQLATVHRRWDKCKVSKKIFCTAWAD
jgi:hypothetical protein